MLLKAQEIGKIRLFCDNNFNLQGMKQQGLMVSSLAGAYKLYPDAVYVVPDGKYADEMRQQLLACRIGTEQIVSFNIAENDTFLRKL